MRMKIYCAIFVIMATFASPAAYADEIVLGYGTDMNIRQFTDPSLTSSEVLVGGVNITSFGADAGGVYVADGTQVFKYSWDGDMLDDSYYSAFRLVTVAPDGDAYAYNGSELVRMSQHNLKNMAILVSGAGGAQSIAAGELGVYFADYTSASRYPYTGGWAVDWSYVQAQRVVAVGPDGYVYTRTHNQTLRHDPADLKNFAIIHVWNAASELMDFDGNPIWRNSQIVDIAVGSDAFYAADGTYIWKFELGGGQAIARSDAGGYTLVEVLRGPVIGDFDGDGQVDIADLHIFTDEWLSCTSPTGDGCIVAASRVIPQGSATVDGNLDDWLDATWFPLDENYHQTAPDVTSAHYAVRWDTTKSVLYLAVIVYDTNMVFADFDPNWVDTWNASDRLEIFSQGSADGGVYYDPQFDPVQYYAQQYVMGMGPSGPWCVFGSTDPGIVPSDPDFAYAINVDEENGRIIYEVAIPQYDTYGGILDDPFWPTVESELTADKAVRFDLLVSSRWGVSDEEFGVLGENTAGPKHINASTFASYNLAGLECGDWGYLIQDLHKDCYVDLKDFAVFASHWLEGVFDD